MRLAVSVPAVDVPLGETVQLVRRCADWGYREAWGSEVAGPDFASVLGAVAVSTDMALGVAVAPVQTRAPWLLAATAVTLSHLSQGRFVLGLGTSSELIVERWSGVPFVRPLARLRETVQVVREILAGERVDLDGEFVTTHGYPLFAPPPAPVPIYLGALGPASLRQAGEIGDGVCLNQLGAEHVPMVLDEVRRGMETAGKQGRPEVVARLFCWVTDDAPAARERVRRMFAPYAATSVYNRFFRWLGFEDEMDALLEAFGRRDREASAAALSDAFIDACYVVGDADHVAGRVQAYVDAGVTLPVIAAIGDSERTLRAIGTALA